MSATLCILGWFALLLMLYGISTDIGRARRRWRDRRQVKALEALYRAPSAKDREAV